MCNTHPHLVPGRSSAWLDEAVTRAVHEILDPRLAYMLQTLAASQRPPAVMPQGQAVLLWLKDNMPRTAGKLLARLRGQSPISSDSELRK